LGADGFKSRHYAEERLIDGENFYRLKDYQRAAIIFMDIIESYSGHAAYPDALYYFSDSLFLSRDFFGARQWFSRLLDESGKPGMARFRLDAVGRLIEIAIHLNDFDGVEKYFQMLGQNPDAEAYYIKGKYLYFKKNYDAAIREFSFVRGDLELELKAKYFTGVVLTKQQRYDEAIETFESGVNIPVKTPAEQEIIDLMNLGMGRLLYEKEFVENASVAYQRIDRYSIYYDTALYEAASVQIRSGNTIAAERILEVLTLAMPDSMYIPKAKLLRGNLLLRAGRYDEAEKVFSETISEFTPVKNQIDLALNDRGNADSFFTSLLERSMNSLDVSGALPPLVVKWVGEEPQVRRALTLSSDLGVAKEYARETERLLRLVEAVIDGPSRINAIPTLRSAKRRCQTLSNRLGQLRGELLRIGESKLKNDSEMVVLAQKRKKLQRQLDALPVSDDDFQIREEKSRSVYKRMRHELSRNEIRLDNLVAMVVALERFVENPEYIEGVSQENLDGFKSELTRHRDGVEEMRSTLEGVREDVEKARYQIGVGDSDDQKDVSLKSQMKALSRKEQSLLRAKAGNDGQRLDRVFQAMEHAENVIEKVNRAIEREASEQIEKMRRQVEAERKRVKQYRRELVVLNEEADEVVSGVTLENFSSVKNKFHKLILKADVGIVDVAWMRKEEHKARSISLTKDRLAEIQGLDAEFEEVRDLSSSSSE